MNDLIDNSKEEKREKKSNRRRERELSDIRFILKRPEGRRFYWRLMSEGKVFLDPFCNDNTNGTNYNLGRQSISRTFLNDLLEAEPESYQLMQQEANSEAEDDKRQDEMDIKQSGGISLTTSFDVM